MGRLCRVVSGSKTLVNANNCGVLGLELQGGSSGDSRKALGDISREEASGVKALCNSSIHDEGVRGLSSAIDAEYETINALHHIGEVCCFPPSDELVYPEGGGANDLKR